MRHDSSTTCWNKASREFCELVEENNPNNPGYFLPLYTLEQFTDVAGKRVLDLGCGEGRYSRALAQRGADVTGIDCAAYALDCARRKAEEAGLRISYQQRNSNELTGFAGDSFDIVLCAMMLMDCEDFAGTIREIARVLKPGGRFWCSVLHPCFNGKGIGRQDTGIDRKAVVENYFSPAEWEQPLSRQSEIPVIWRHRTMQDYVKTFIGCGLTITDLNEPVPTPEQAAISTGIAWLQKIPIFLFWELTK